MIATPVSTKVNTATTDAVIAHGDRNPMIAGVTL
jgi:hypothetical protein